MLPLQEPLTSLAYTPEVAETTDSVARAPLNVQTAIQELREFSFDEMIDSLSRMLVKFAIDVAIAILVFYVGKFIIGRIYRFIGAIMVRRNVDNSLATFVLSFVRIVLYFILVITVIGILGVETSSFVALFASAGVAIGMALSGTLQNFAGGVLILFLKPYKVGDYIEAQGFAGTVREVQIFHTLISTYDNKAILIPNGMLSTTSINNWSRENYRRVSWDVAISYGDDVDVARGFLLGMFDNDERVVTGYVDADGDGFDDNTGELLPEGAANPPTRHEAEEEKPRGFFSRIFHKKPNIKEAIISINEGQEKRLQSLRPKVTQKPSVVVSSLGDSSVNLQLRVWTRSENYWNVFYEYNERIYKELPKTGVSFPFPQMDVHIKSGPHEA